MIVVRAEQHVGVLQLRIAALDDADDVAGQARLNDVVGGVDVDRDRDVLERDRRQRLLLVGLRLEVGVVQPAALKMKSKNSSRRGDLRRHQRVEPLHGLKIAEGLGSRRHVRHRRVGLRRFLAPRRLRGRAGRR